MCSYVRGETPEDSKTDPDTSKTYHLDEVVVTATRNALLQITAPASVVAVTRRQLESEPGSTINTALDGIAGLSLRSYGGSGSLQSVSS